MLREEEITLKSKYYQIQEKKKNEREGSNTHTPHTHQFFKQQAIVLGQKIMQEWVFIFIFVLKIIEP